MMETYLVNYPSPPRGKYSGAVPTNDSEITVLKESKGHLELSFTREELIRYLTTQSNIEAVVKTGKSYDDIEIELDKSMPIYEPSQRFRYSFTYGVYQYNR